MNKREVLATLDPIIYRKYRKEKWEEFDQRGYPYWEKEMWKDIYKSVPEMRDIAERWLKENGLMEEQQ